MCVCVCVCFFFSIITILGILEPMILLDLVGVRWCEDKMVISERTWHEPLREFCLEVI